MQDASSEEIRKQVDALGIRLEGRLDEILAHQTVNTVVLASHFDDGKRVLEYQIEHWAETMAQAAEVRNRQALHASTHGSNDGFVVQGEKYLLEALSRRCS